MVCEPKENLKLKKKHCKKCFLNYQEIRTGALGQPHPAAALRVPKGDDGGSWPWGGEGAPGSCREPGQGGDCSWAGESGRSMAARGWGPEGAGQLQTSLLAGFLPSFSRSPHRAPRPTWVPGLDSPRALSLIPRLHQPCCAPPPNQTLTAPTLPALQHHLGSPPSSHSPWVRPGQEQGCPRASRPEGPARFPGAQGDQVCLQPSGPSSPASKCHTAAG